MCIFFVDRRLYLSLLFGDLIHPFHADRGLLPRLHCFGDELTQQVTLAPETVCVVLLQQLEPVLCSILGAVPLKTVVRDISSFTSLAPILIS